MFEEKSLEERVFNASKVGAAVGLLAGAFYAIGTCDVDQVTVSEGLIYYFSTVAKSSGFAFFVGGAFPLAEKGFNYTVDKINQYIDNNF